MKEKVAKEVVQEAPQSLGLRVDEHYSVRTSLYAFEAQLVAIEGPWLVFQKSKLLSQHLKHHLNGDLERLPEGALYVGANQVVDLVEWLPSR